MKIYLIGIGGIGVSALAQYYLANGHKVSGSDLASSEITDLLKKKGIKVFIGKHNSQNLNKIATAERFKFSKVIYSPAVKENNPELKKAKKLGIKCLSYPEALGELTKQYFTIAVSGTHGKSTTTAMLALILIKAHLDPTVIIGTKVKEFKNSNFRSGKSKYLIIEACEHEQAFLNYWPKIIVLTNIEKEHLDYYKNLNNILKAFERFVKHLQKDGVLVVNGDDRNIKNLISNFQFPISNKFSIINFQLGTSSSQARAKLKDVKKLKKILKVPGEHNIYNALAALTVARTLKIPDKISFQALSKYTGCWRRFEITKILHPKSYTLINDYAHHPTEIKTTLKAAREKFPKKEIWCVFQPHQYQRTFYLFKDFVKVFNDALEKNWLNKLIITDVYDVAGRESNQIRKKTNSKKLVKSIVLRSKTLLTQNIIYLSNFEKIKNYLKKNLEGEEIIVIMGAGDIYTLARQNFLPENLGGLDKKLIK